MMQIVGKEVWVYISLSLSLSLSFSKSIDDLNMLNVVYCICTHRIGMIHTSNTHTHTYIYIYISDYRYVVYIVRAYLHVE